MKYAILQINIEPRYCEGSLQEASPFDRRGSNIPLQLKFGTFHVVASTVVLGQSCYDSGFCAGSYWKFF